MSKETVTNRMLVEIVLHHKEKVLADGVSKARLESRLNSIIDRFVARTGRKLTALHTKEQDGKHRIMLEVE